MIYAEIEICLHIETQCQRHRTRPGRAQLFLDGKPKEAIDGAAKVFLPMMVRQDVTGLLPGFVNSGMSVECSFRPYS